MSLASRRHWGHFLLDSIWTLLLSRVLRHRLRQPRQYVCVQQSSRPYIAGISKQMPHSSRTSSSSLCSGSSMELLGTGPTGGSWR